MKPKESTYIRANKAKPTGHKAENMKRGKDRKAEYFRPQPSNELPHTVVDHIVLVTIAALAYLKLLQLGELRPDDEARLGHLLNWAIATNSEGGYKNFEILVFPNNFLNKEFGRLGKGAVWRTRWEHFRGSKTKGKRTTSKSARLREAVAAEPEATKYVPDLTAEEGEHPEACLIDLTVWSMLERMKQYDLRQDSEGVKKASARKRARDDHVPATPEALVTAFPLPTAEARETAAKRMKPTKIAAVEMATEEPGPRPVCALLEETSPELPNVESHFQMLFGLDFSKALEAIESLEAQEEASKELPEAGKRKDDYLLLSAESPEDPAGVEDNGDVPKDMEDVEALLDAAEDLGPFHLMMV